MSWYLRKKAEVLAILIYLFVVGFAFSVSAASISLVADTNIPEPNQEITIQIQTDTPLFAMGIGVYIMGDANITSAMCEADCNEYGWDNGWNSDPYIENGYIYLSGVRWDSDANGTVGYFKFRYNSGQVSVYIDQENSCAFGYDWENETSFPVPFSTDTLLFGEAEPNDFNEGEYLITDENTPAEDTNIPEDFNLPQSNWKNQGHRKYLMHCPSTDISDINRTAENALYSNWRELFRGFSKENNRQLNDNDINMQSEEEGQWIDIWNDVNTPTIWRSGNVYYINTIINVTSLLVIEPGTIIFLTGSIYVNNNGCLISVGLPDYPVIYSSGYLYPEPGDYQCAIYVEETASPATKISYNYIEYASVGIVTDNIRLDNPISNNYLFENVFGIGVGGTHLTDIINNLCIDNMSNGIDIAMEDWNGVADGNSYILLKNNTCDWYQNNGIAVHGTEDINNAGFAELINNIVTRAISYGLNICPYEDGDTYVFGFVSNTGYGANEENKNWEFPEENPVEVEDNPYWTDLGPAGVEEFYNTYYGVDFVVNYLDQNCPFINAGLDYIEETPMIGKTTDAYYNKPDSNKIDIGFHHPNWYYSNAGFTTLSADLNNDFVVDFKDLEIFTEYWLSPFDNFDFAVLADEWGETTESSEPNIQINLYGDGSNGFVEAGISNYGWNTSQAFLLVDGEYADNLFGFRDDQHALVNVAALGPGPHQFKVISMDSSSTITCSHIKEAEFNSPFNYTACNYAYEVNKPLYFGAIVSDANVTVKAIDDENNVLWMQTYLNGNVNSFVPSAITGNTDVDIDQIILEKSGGSSGIVSLSATPRFDPKNVGPSVRALVVLPDAGTNVLNLYSQETVKSVLRSLNIRFYKLKESQATSANMAWFARNRNIQYLYYDGHGNYVDYRNEPNKTFRTNIYLYDISAFSFKQSDFDPNNIPSWCKKLGGHFEDSVTSVSIYSMGFHTLKFAHLDCCYTGRLGLFAGQIVEGPPGNVGLAMDVPNDMAVALGIGTDENPDSFYQGWYDIAPAGHPSICMYTKFTKNEWRNLGEEETFYQALLNAIFSDTIRDPYTGRFASDDLRLSGRWLYFYTEGLE